MANELAKTNVEKSLKTLDEISAGATIELYDAKARFMQMYKKAQMVTQIRQLLTPEVIAQVILPLKNLGEAGFRTDEKPGNEYGIDVIANVMTEAILTGVRPDNNELMIFKSRLFRQKNHYRRVVREFPGLSELRIAHGDYRMSAGGARVDIRASWKLKGQPMEMNCVGPEAIPVKLNEGMGADGAIGKAEARILARIYRDLTGSDHSDCDETEDLDVGGLKQATGSDVTHETKSTSQTASLKDDMRKQAASEKVAEKPIAATATTSPATTATTATASPTTATAAATGKKRAGFTKESGSSEFKREAPKTEVPKTEVKAEEPKQAAAPKVETAPAAPKAEAAKPVSTPPADPGPEGKAGESGSPDTLPPAPELETFENVMISFAGGMKDPTSGEIVAYALKDSTNSKFITKNKPLAMMGKEAKEKGLSCTIIAHKEGDHYVISDLAINQPESEDGDGLGDEGSSGGGVPEDQSQPAESAL